MRRLLTLIASVVPCIVGAQSPDATPVPRDLFAAYQTRYADLGMGMERPAFVVGKLPTRDFDQLVPAGAAVLGGIVLRRSSGAVRVRSAALLLGGTKRDAESLTIEHLKSRGYRHATPPAEEGFTSTRESTFSPLNNFLCGDSTAIHFTTQDRAEGGAYVVFDLDRIRGEGGACNPSPRMTALNRPSMPRHLMFPLLEAPPDASGRQTGGSGWSTDAKTRSITAELETDLSAEAVVEHYTRELVKSGWKPTKRMKEKSVVIQLLTDESGGNPRELVLSDVVLPDRSHNVTAQIYAVLPRGR